MVFEISVGVTDARHNNPDESLHIVIKLCLTCVYAIINNDIIDEKIVS